MYGEPIQIGVPVAGYYRTRLISSGMWVAVRFWFGSPIIDGEEQDRSLRWCVEVDGRTDRFDKEVGHRVPLDALDVWPWAAGHPITEREYRFLLRRKVWAVKHSPEHPAARPHEPIDLRKLKPLEP